MLNKTVNNVELKMLRKGNKCWMKIAPSSMRFDQTSLHIILNEEKYDFEIYDKHGNETHNIFLKGENIAPSFYIKSERNRFRVDCKENDIVVIQIKEKHNGDEYLKNNCSFSSPKTTIWAVNIFYTKTSDKPPFDTM